MLDVFQGSEYASECVAFTQSTQLAFTYSKLTIETLEQGVKYVQSQWRRQWRRSGVFIVKFEHMSNLVLVIL